MTREEAIAWLEAEKDRVDEKVGRAYAAGRSKKGARLLQRGYSLGKVLDALDPTS